MDINLGINWTQIIATVLANAIVVPATAIFTFIVMRYFPGFWEKIEKFAKNMIKSAIIVKVNGKDTQSGKEGNQSPDRIQPKG